MEQNSNSSDPMTEWVTFYLGDEKYGINVMHVREVLKHSEIAPVPGAPYFVRGIINLRGNVVTVIETRIRLGLPVIARSEATRIIVVELNESVIGMIVDAVAEVINMPRSLIEYAPSVGNDESARYIQGVANIDDQLLILVDLAKLFSLDGESESSGG
jgi:purine-binding chemotaxis protein CheW